MVNSPFFNNGNQKTLKYTKTITNTTLANRIVENNP